jgi:hypothetical protein
MGHASKDHRRTGGGLRAATAPVRVGAGGIAEVMVLDLEDAEAEAMFHLAR